MAKFFEEAVFIGRFAGVETKQRMLFNRSNHKHSIFLSSHSIDRIFFPSFSDEYQSGRQMERKKSER